MAKSAHMHDPYALKIYILMVPRTVILVTREASRGLPSFRTNWIESPR